MNEQPPETIDLEDIDSVCEDACTHGLYLSEVEAKSTTGLPSLVANNWKKYYRSYLIDKARYDLIDE
jgi:hypothetical protein